MRNLTSRNCALAVLNFWHTTILVRKHCLETYSIHRDLFVEKVRYQNLMSLYYLQVNVYNERKSLTLSLNDAKTAIEELNRVASGVVLIVIIIVWLLVMGWATTKVLILISSQLLLVAFMFGNTCKTVFEAMIFVFVMHPFDVGDRCVIDGVQVRPRPSIFMILL